MPSERMTGGQVGPYKIQALHGRGGVADVYQGVHTQAGTEVAIKVIRSELIDDKDRLRDFKTEADLLSGLEHGSIPAMKRLDAIGKRPAMVLDFIPGETLKQLVEDPAARFDRVGASLALINVVAYLHGKQVIHNDLKLENVILRPDGRIGLVDFGNARKAGGKGLLSKLFGRGGRQVFGTASYLAPELIQGGKPSFATDIYALGVCMHLLFSGAAHFDDTRRTQRLNRIVKEEAPSIGTKVPQLPKPMATIIDRCVERNPAHRPADAGELKQAIKRSIGEPFQQKARQLSVALDAALSVE